MSMYHGLDLSRFKKAGSDAKTTTLIHSKGHELKIAHSALSPEMKEKIGGLKCSHCDQVGCKCQKMAKGGKVSKAAKDDTFDTADSQTPEDFRAQSAFEGLPGARQLPTGDNFDETDLGSPDTNSGGQFWNAHGDVKRPSVLSDPDISRGYERQGSAKPAPAVNPDAPTGDEDTREQAAPFNPNQNPTVKSYGVPNPSSQYHDVTSDSLGGGTRTEQFARGQMGLPEYISKPEPVPEAPPEVIGQAVEQHENKQSQMFANELATGKINPMTIKDYFHNRDTLGKIGTIFGLLVSGAGSGLAHQQNAALELINKELDRDLEGQKLSQSNAQNWYKMSIEHERNKALNAKTMAEIPLTEAQKNLAQAEANYRTALESKVPYDILQAKAAYDKAKADTVLSAAMGDFRRGQAKKAGFDTTASDHAAKNMAIGASQILQDIIDKMGEGPAKQQAQNIHDTVVAPAVGAKVTDINKQLGSKAATDASARQAAPKQQVPTIAPPGVPTTLPKTTKGQAVNPVTQPEEPSENAPVEDNFTSGKKGPVRNADQYGKEIESEGAPKFIKPKEDDVIDKNIFRNLSDENKQMKMAELPNTAKMTDDDKQKIQEEEKQANAILKIRRAYNKAFRALNDAHKATKHINPELYKAQVNQLAIIMGKETAGRSIMSEIASQAGGAFPDIKDWGGSSEQKYYNTMRMLQDRYDTSTKTIDNFPGLKREPDAVPDPWGREIRRNKKTGQRFQKDTRGKWIEIQ